MNSPVHLSLITFAATQQKSNVTMKIISSSGKGNFKLIDNDIEICELNYKNWFSGKASTYLQNNNIEIKPRNIWASKMEIFRNKEFYGEITFSLKGHMIIELKSENGAKQRYILKNKGLFKPKFELYNAKKVHQLTMVQKNNWTKINYDYLIEIADCDQDANIEELLIFCGYASNLYQTMMSAV